MKSALENISADSIIASFTADLEKHLYKKIAGRPDSFLIARAVHGGKRIRPILLLTVFKALGGVDYHKALDVAVALELAHSASLVHDDIVDQDRNRRSSPSLWYQIGAGKAIIQGHRIINLAFQIVLDIGEEMSRIFVTAWDRASKGILDEVINKAALTERLYLVMIREKTASLFEAAAHAGAVLAGASPEQIDLMRRFGSEVGTAYQMADDLVDIYLRKKRGRLYFLTHEMRERLVHLLISTKTKQLRGLIRAVAPRIPDEDFLKRQIVERLSSAVLLAKDPLIPESPYKTVLQLLPRMFVNRMIAEAHRRV
ncbi:MAG: polyprenyl synthetase family protein [Candidatus Caldarchaeum sp.]|nr:polyprenyl synthetase family protein [Candidatus Caldarchaeum sp.]